MALSILGSLAALTAPRPAAQAARPAAAQPAAQSAATRAQAPVITDRRSAPAVQVRLSPQALALLGGAREAEKPQGTGTPAQAGRTSASASAFQPLSFARMLDSQAEAAPPPSGATGATGDPARPARVLRPGSRLDIKL
ncbi:MAG: hypothetical protein KDJ46_01190 [Rhodobiaceae bacterium]|nr:hypothetical protein [Rhodobiaceae bacterium]